MRPTFKVNFDYGKNIHDLVGFTLDIISFVYFDAWKCWPGNVIANIPGNNYIVHPDHAQSDNQYTQLVQVKLSITASVAQSLERWFRYSQDRVPSRKILKCHFRNSVVSVASLALRNLPSLMVIFDNVCMHTPQY